MQLDLLQLFPFTESGQEVDVIDLGTSAAEAHLLTGWSQGETLPSGESVAWGLARRSSVRFAVRKPADGRVVLRCGIFETTARGSALVLVSLNRRRVGSLRLRQHLEDHALALPARLQRSGPNELELLNPHAFRSSRWSDRSRPIVCDTIRFEGRNGDAGRRPVVGRDGKASALVIPAPARVDFFLRIPPAGAVAFGLEAAREGRANVRVSLQREQANEQVLFNGGSSSPPVRLDLARHAGEVARLSFEALGEGAVRLVRPRVLGTAAREATSAVAPRKAPRPNILLYVVDTLRADHLGCYGYPRPTSPHIDALAAEGLLFNQTVAQSSWTTPATASILTGRYPYGHGALALGERMRPDVPTLAEVLRDAGYRTAAFVTNANVRGELGFRRGFDQYRYLPEEENRPTVHLPADRLHKRVVSWLEKNDGRPFFLYVHASDPHAPYTPPARLAERFREPGPVPALAEVRDPQQALHKDSTLRTPENVTYLASLYDAEIALTDNSLGQLLREVTRLGLYDESIIVLTPDHGEELQDHGGLGHGHTLYREQTWVPFILRLPGGRPGGERVFSLAQQIDILPTLLDYLGIARPDGVDGRSLLPPAHEAARREVEGFNQTSLGLARQSAVVTSAWKVIQGARRDPAGRDQHRFEVYDLRADPAEKNDLVEEAPVLLGYGRQLLVQWTASAPRQKYARDAMRAGPPLDKRVRERLKALGYVN